MTNLQNILSRTAKYKADEIAKRVIGRYRRYGGFPQVNHYPPVVVACAQNSVSIDYAETNINSPFVYESISYIVTSFSKEMLARTKILNINIFDIQTELINKITNLELYQDALNKLLYDQQVQDVF